MMMSAIKLKFASLLDESSLIPTDVTFEVQDEDDTVHVFKAHKHYLALVSRVFEAKFFGSLKETKETVVISETTSQAFGTMIRFIYQKDSNWNENSVTDLFEIANLANYYDVAGMMTKVEEVVGEYPINLANVVYLAFIADQFSMFSNVSQILLGRCAAFLFQTLLTHVLDFSGLFSDHQYASAALRLHNMILEMPMPYFCTNCNQFICQNRKPVHQDVHLGCTVSHPELSSDRIWEVATNDGEGRVSLYMLYTGPAYFVLNENIAVSEVTYDCWI
eukprot:GFUD01010587.1.p1 GENE.GFUD01010587.1~~GFUD01010587.1.p1  ORF type:complete len:276 (-),score=35.40 GFUD01010587.1:71-898(-)